MRELCDQVSCFVSARALQPGTEHLTHPLTHLLVHILVQIYHDSLYADNLAWLRTITSDRLLFRLLIDELVCGQCMHLSACRVRICIQLLLLHTQAVDISRILTLCTIRLVCSQCMHVCMPPSSSAYTAPTSHTLTSCQQNPHLVHNPDLSRTHVRHLRWR